MSRGSRGGHQSNRSETYVYVGLRWSVLVQMVTGAEQNVQQGLIPARIDQISRVRDDAFCSTCCGARVAVGYSRQLYRVRQMSAYPSRRRNSNLPLVEIINVFSTFDCDPG